MSRISDMGMPSLGGLSVGLLGGGAAPSPNPNLLLWSEEMDRPEWVVAGGASVDPDQIISDDPYSGVADGVDFAALNSTLSQTTTVAVATGSGGQTIGLSAEWVRESFSLSMNGTTYVVSLMIIEDSGAGSDIQLRMDAVGGFLRVQLRDVGDNPTVRVVEWKLETPTLTDYVKREGT